MAPATPLTLTILRRRQVEARVGLRCSQLYELMHEGRFPQSIRLGKRSVGWLEHEVHAWLVARIAESRAEGGR